MIILYKKKLIAILILFLAWFKLEAQLLAPQQDKQSDTLEIFILYTEFKEETLENDIPTTTGRGTFNSHKDKKNLLDPDGARRHRFYMDKHMQFAQGYYSEVSKGKLNLKWEIFPSPDSKTGLIEKPYRLSEYMPYYNPTKNKKEKGEVFAQRRGEALLKMVSETIRLADADPAGPFKRKTPPTAKTKRAYLIFHAGHNALVDGGNLGSLGANTPNDINDFFVSPDDFALLAQLKNEESNPLKAKKADSIGIVVGSGDLKDTLNQVMMLSESASQDGVNFGINGILINQIARQIGLPDTWDRARGFTQLGNYDLMDVGHLAQLGHIPVYPSAWLRLYMGWDQAVIASPDEKGVFQTDVFVPGTEGKTTLVKIPLNEKEYLLVENRQKSVQDSVKVYFSQALNQDDVAFSLRDSIQIPVKFLDSLFLDSLCKKGEKCRPNPYRPRGIITGFSPYDAGIPGSGLITWHVNEWFIEKSIRYGIVNAADKQTIQYKGLSLVEADGDLTMGIQGRDATGQSRFDFGSPSDILPHIRKKAKVKNNDTTWRVDTLLYIHPWSRLGTQSWNGARTSLAIQALIPDSAKLRKEVNFFTGDTIINFAKESLKLKVHFNALASAVKLPLSKWPQRGIKSTFNPLVLPFTKDSLYWADFNDRGDVEFFTSLGQALIQPTDSLVINESYDSLETLLPTGQHRDSLKIYRFASHTLTEKLVSTALANDSVLVGRTESGKAYMISTDTTLKTGGVVELGEGFTGGPLTLGGTLYFFSDTSIEVFNSSGLKISSAPGPGRPTTAWALLDSSDGNVLLTAVDSLGSVYISNVTNAAGKWVTQALTQNSEHFDILVSDFNRDRNPDVWVVGTSGIHSLFIKKGVNWEPAPGFPKSFVRLVSGQNPKKQSTPPAVADVNLDGYPDLILSVPNGINVFDQGGQSLSGWPFTFNKTMPLGYTQSVSSPLGLIASNILIIPWEGKPIILCATPDGQIEALDGQGKRVTTSSFDSTSDYAKYSAPAAIQKNDFPLATGYLPYLSQPNTMQLAAAPFQKGLLLVSKSEEGFRDLWFLDKATENPSTAFKSSNSWLLWAGNPQRLNHFSTNNWDPPKEVQKTAKIQEFFLFPAPLRQSRAGLFIKLGDYAQKVQLRVINISGRVVIDQAIKIEDLSLQISDQTLDMGFLGAGVYSVQAKVTFKNGQSDVKWFTIGLIR